MKLEISEARRVVLLAAIGACNPSSPPPFVAEPVAIPAALVVPATKRVCSRAHVPAAWASKGAREKVFDFAPIQVPLAYGPADIAPEGFRRHPDSVHLAILGKTDRLVACYRSFASQARVHRVDHPSRSMGAVERFDAELTVDPFGMAHDVRVTSDGAPAPPCLADTLATIRVNGRTPRETRATVELVFMHVSDATRAPLPPAEPPDERPGCVRARDPIPRDSLEVEAVFLDLAPAREPVLAPACALVDTDKQDIRATIDARLGSLRACYRDARTRIPALAGTVMTRFVVGRWGDFTEVEIAGQGDARLWACIADVYAELATSRLPEVPVRVARLPLELDPSPPPAELAKAIEARDTDGAAALASREASGATTLDAACRARAHLVQAYAGAPDARFDAAFDTFVRFVGEHDRGSLVACIAELVPTVGAAFRWPVRANADRTLSLWRDRGLAEAAARAQRGVAALPELAEPLLPFLGDARVVLREYDTAIETYLAFLALGTRDRARIRAVADGYAAATRARAGGPPDDPCEAAVRF